MATSRRGLVGTDITSRAIWVVAGVIVLNHLMLDPVLTVYRLHTTGGYELNPIWRGMIQSDPGLFLLLQVPMIAVFIGCYRLLFVMIDREQPPWDAWLVRGVWWGSLLLVCWGLISTYHHVFYLFLQSG